MNPEEIIKNNILIATKLMGMEFTPTNTILLDKTVKPQRAFRPEDLDYHKNWNSLMPVVEKVEDLGYGVTIYRKGCQINDVFSTTNGFNHSSKKEETYKAIVKFINLKI